MALSQMEYDEKSELLGDIVSVSFTAPSTSVPANGAVSVTCTQSTYDLTKYQLLGVHAISTGNDDVVFRSVNAAAHTLKLRNLTGSAISVAATMSVMYVKNK